MGGQALLQHHQKLRLLQCHPEPQSCCVRTSLTAGVTPSMLDWPISLSALGVGVAVVRESVAAKKMRVENFILRVWSFGAKG